MTSIIDRQHFFAQAGATLFNGPPRPSQAAGLTVLLDLWESSYKDLDDRWLAYMLATAHHETDRTMRPIAEYGRGKGKPYGKPDPETGQVYYGRGYVQLTWRENYKRMSRCTGLDLVRYPDLAMEPATAAKILFEGMIYGRFTGHALRDYLWQDRSDWRNARRVVNGLDKANLIADYAVRYYAAISYREA